MIRRYDQGEAFTELIKIQEDFFKDNFVASLMVLGCSALSAWHNSIEENGTCNPVRKCPARQERDSGLTF